MKEKEERTNKCFTFLPRKKLLFVFVAVNVIFWVIYNNSCFSTYMNYNFTLKKGFESTYTTIYNVSLFHIPLLGVKDMATYYVEIKVDTWCMRYNIDLKLSRKQKKCICVENWFGNDCGIPAAVWNSTFSYKGKNVAEIRRRTRPRRIIISYAVDDYLDLLEINIHTAFSIVDLFLTVQDNNSYPSIVDRFKQGYLTEYQSKIMPLQLNKSLKSKNYADFSTLMLSELWSIGWKKLADFRPDDIFLFSHVTSIISKDVLLFLKFYEGFPEPFLLELRPVLFKFWKKIKHYSIDSKVIPFKPLGCTFQFIASMCEYNVRNFFSNKCLGNLQLKTAFEKNYWPISTWSVGNAYAPSGWQCNLCCKAACIQKNIKKILQNDSFLLLNLKNISDMNHFVANNLFSSANLSFNVISKDDIFFSPDIVMRNKKFRYLIN